MSLDFEMERKKIEMEQFVIFKCSEKISKEGSEEKRKTERKKEENEGRRKRRERGRKSYVIMIHISLTSSFNLKHYYCS